MVYWDVMEEGIDLLELPKVIRLQFIIFGNISDELLFYISPCNK